MAKGSNYRALWKCSSAGCGHEWRAQVGTRTLSDRPHGCPKCNPGGSNGVTPTDNFLTWCAQNGRRGAELLREYRDPKKLPDEVKKGVELRGALEVCEVQAQVADEDEQPHEEGQTHQMSAVQPSWSNEATQTGMMDTRRGRRRR